MTDSFTWTGTNTYLVQDSTTLGRLNVDSGNLAAVGTHTVSVQNTVTIASNGGSSSTFTPIDASDKVEFTVTIENPCLTTTVNTITVSGTDS